MKVTFLGTGTSQGVPVIACPCEVCHSADEKDKRLRTSVLIGEKGKNFVIDTGPDFRQQMLSANVQELDAVIYTHEHKDHLAGIDDVRAFNYFQKKKMDLYATTRVQEAILREIPYAFTEEKYPGVPEVTLHQIRNAPFAVSGVTFHPIEVFHHKLPVLGFRVNDFTYITDANFIPEQEKEKIKGSNVVVLNALRREEHISHFTLGQAIALAEELGAGTTYLTHISHQLGKHADVSKELPANVKLAYDGLVLEL
jgi:phosphoribosyl 1,2-cyclic phosphate phosphodiesterase